mmetsp:Transcript_8929/g.24754  ORF Transcript_8929/g.24754 Transcript_8929/m.24754 type:complete len:331 (-) Transcript_8929:37-1029(-)|eukprot:CAMPEP_0179109626 /NCGR_PEP_ID=MMETSP0796-20121207/51126_1 /TAXON_ID=73915 /ORGANISM="Pyrodinium bahamense, Strain pbaha01" /LENGTH=330 /DNA_ID=CAMNT_0020807741 /DNA_START=73 /DNA_END=1065 /DNA_ORIENTATION=-
MARFALGIASFLHVVTGSLAQQHEVDIPRVAQQRPAEAEALDKPASREDAAADCPSSAAIPECAEKATCLQVRLLDAVRHAEDLSAALDDLVEIDRLASRSDIGAVPSEEHRKELEAELKELEQRVQNGEANSTLDTEAIIRQLKADIQALNVQEERTLRRETRRVGEAARTSARGLQEAARGEARTARALADRLGRVAHELRGCQGAVDSLVRRTEAATDRAERAGEVLSRRIDRVVRSRLESAEAQMRQKPAASLREASAAVGRSAGTHEGSAAAVRLFQARSGHFLSSEGGFLMLVSASAGFLLVVLLVQRGSCRTHSVNAPKTALG